MNPTDARSDATPSGGGRGGSGGSAAGGATTGGAGGAGNRGGTGGKGGGAGSGAHGGAGGGAGAGRCTTFQFQPSHPCPDQILVDMNGDGRLDVVSGWSDTTGLHVMVYRQTAPRVFADPDQYDYGTSVYYLERMAAADLDQDGIPDVAIPDAYGRVALLLSGSGTGYSFAPLLVSSKQEDLYDVALADFDGDGYRDIAVPVYDTSASLGIYWGAGRGAFAIRADQKLCSLGTRTTVVDANEDGHPDLAVACMGGGGQVLINQGGRSFTPVLLPGASQSYDSATGDLNNDGHMDVVIPDRILKQLIVSLGDGHGNFTVATGSVAATTSSPVLAKMGDLDGDGKADVLLSDSALTTLAFYRGTGDGHFQAPVTFPAAGTSRNLTIGDVDGDGFQALIVGDGPTIVYGPCP